MKYVTRWAEQKPRFEHDCTYCQWLGHDGEADLYACGKIDDEGYYVVNTVIARFGNSPDDYSSGSTFAFTGPGHLQVAMARVIYQNGRFIVDKHTRAEAWDRIIVPMFKSIATTP